MMQENTKTDIESRKINRILSAFRSDESGATSIEYGMIASLIIIAIIAAVQTFSDTTSAMYTNVSDNLS